MFPALLPKSAPFFAMLNEQNDLLRRMSALLVNMLEDVSNMDHVHKEIAFLEEEADMLHSKIIRALSQTFITPIDREDILRINQEQEECMDCLHSLSTRLHIFEFTRIRFPALQMARTISAMLDMMKQSPSKAIQKNLMDYYHLKALNKYISVPEDYLLGRVLATNIVDPETGEWKGASIEMLY